MREMSDAFTRRCRLSPSPSSRLDRGLIQPSTVCGASYWAMYMYLSRDCTRNTHRWIYSTRHRATPILFCGEDIDLFDSRGPEQPLSDVCGKFRPVLMKQNGVCALRAPSATLSALRAEGFGMSLVIPRPLNFVALEITDRGSMRFYHMPYHPCPNKKRCLR